MRVRVHGGRAPTNCGGVLVQRVFRVPLVLLATLSLVAAGGGQDKSPAPAEQFQALLKEYDRASSSGRRFKLSEYRRKVVLLDFWSFA